MHASPSLHEAPVIGAWVPVVAVQGGSIEAGSGNAMAVCCAYVPVVAGRSIGNLLVVTSAVRPADVNGTGVAIVAFRPARARHLIKGIAPVLSSTVLTAAVSGFQTTLIVGFQGSLTAVFPGVAVRYDKVGLRPGRRTGEANHCNRKPAVTSAKDSLHLT